MPVVPVVIVAGPPCAGKNTHIESNWRQGDLVIDYDQVMATFTRTPIHTHYEPAHWFVLEAIVGAIAKVRTQSASYQGTIWLPTANKPRADSLQRMIPRAQRIDLDPGREVVTTRAQGRTDGALKGIADWYKVEQASKKHAGMAT